MDMGASSRTGCIQMELRTLCIMASKTKLSTILEIIQFLYTINLNNYSYASHQLTCYHY